MPWTPLKGIARAILRKKEEKTTVLELKRAIMVETAVTGKKTLKEYIKIAEELGWIEFDGVDALKMHPEKIDERWKEEI